jgi:hypothetical protein
MVVTYASLQVPPTLPEAGGGFGDVYRGEYNGRPAAVKVMRVYTSNNREAFLSVCTPLPAVRGEPTLNPSLTEVLSRSGGMETSATPKYLTAVRRDIGPAGSKVRVGLEVAE